MLEKIMVGIITSPHGLKGDVKVYATTDEPQRFRLLRNVWIGKDGNLASFRVTSVKYVRNTPVIRFEGVDTIEDAQKLRDHEIYIDRADALPLAEGEYFIGDLVGCTVFLEDGSVLGELADVLRTGANDVYSVRKTDGSEILIPVIPDCVLEKRPEEGRITVRLMPVI